MAVRRPLRAALPLRLLTLEDRITPATADWAEPNDTLADAYYQGQGGSLDWQYFYIADSADVDYFSFRLSGKGLPDAVGKPGTGTQIGIDFPGMNSDLDIALLDANGVQIGSSTGATTSEYVSLSDQPAGQYFLRVYPFSFDATDGSDGPKYSFHLKNGPALRGDLAEPNDTANQPFSLGRVGGVTANTGGLSLTPGLTPGADLDWYRLFLLDKGTTDDYFRTNFIHTDGDISLTLFAEGKADTPLLASDSSSATQNFEQVSLAGLPQGSYLVRVQRSTETAAQAYSFNWHAPAAQSTKLGDRFEANETPAAAADLGTVYGTRAEPGLSRHTAADVDYYKFRVAATPNGRAHTARLSFTSAAGDLDLELLDGSGAILRTSAEAGDVQTVSLGGLAPVQDYYLRVTGPADAAPNPSYTLTLTAPASAAIPADVYDAAPASNDTQAAAVAVSAAPGTTARVEPLTIHTTSDVDWFRFDLPRVGVPGDAVETSFTHAAGDLDLQLVAADGTVLRTSSGVTDGERIGLDGLSVGTYWVKVYGFNRATSPGYKLAVTLAAATAGDSKESNDTDADATLVPRPRRGSAPVVWNNLSIHSKTDFDWFRFTLTGTVPVGGFVRIDFRHAAGDVDLKLFRRNPLDNSVVQVGNPSDSVSDREELSFDGLVAGDYFAEVYGYAGATNPNYTLTVQFPPTGVAADRYESGSGNNTSPTATPLTNQTDGTYVGAGSPVAGLTLHTATDEDWFTFTTVAAGKPGNYVRVESGRTAGGVFDLQVQDPTGAMRVASVQPGATAQVLLEGLAAGPYRVRVWSAAGKTGGYTLSVNAPRDKGAWTVLVYMTASDTPDAARDRLNELERAVARLPGSVNVLVHWDQGVGAKETPVVVGGVPGVATPWQDVGQAVVQPDGSDAIVTPFTRLGERNSGSAAELQSFLSWGVATAPAERYALFVFGHGWLDGVGYDSEGAKPGKGTNFDKLTAAEIREAVAGAGLPNGKLDVVGFDACLMSTAEWVYQLRDAARYVAASQSVTDRAVNYTALFDAVAASPDAYQFTPEAFGDALIAGYRKELGKDRGTATPFAVTTAAAFGEGVTAGPLAAALEDFANAVQIALVGSPDLPLALREALSTELTRSYDSAINNVSGTGLFDLGQFLFSIQDRDLKYATAVSDTLRGRAEAARLQVVAAVGPRRSKAVGTDPRYGDAGQGYGLSIYVPTGDLTQYPLYDDFLTATGWRKVIDALRGRGLTIFPGSRQNEPVTVPDDTPEQPVVLPPQTGTGVPGVGVLAPDRGDDVDWVRFDTLADGGPGDAVEVAGGVTATLYRGEADGTRTLLQISAQSLSLTGRSAGTYYVEFRPTPSLLEGPVGYTFRVNAPAGTVTPTNTNNSLARARGDEPLALGPVRAVHYFTTPLPDLATGSRAGWHRLQSPILLNRLGVNVYVRVAAGTPATAELLDAAGNPLATADTDPSGLAHLRYVLPGDGREYFLRVAGQAGQQMNYTVELAPNAAPTAEPQAVRTLAYPDAALAITPDKLATDTDDPTGLVVLDARTTSDAVTVRYTAAGLTVERVAGKSGKATIVVRVADPAGAEVSLTFDVDVKPNHPPTLVLTPAGPTVTTAAPVTFQVTATDPDGTAVAPEVKAFDPTYLDASLVGGTLTITPKLTRSGPSDVVVRVRDDAGPEGNEVTKTVTVTVPNTPPEVRNAPATLTVAPGTLQVVEFDVFDRQTLDQPLAVTATSTSPGVIASAPVLVGGRWQVTVRAAGGFAGSATVTLTARDGGVGRLVATHAVAVTVPNTAPTVTGLAGLTDAQRTLAVSGRALLPLDLPFDVADAQTDPFVLTTTAVASTVPQVRASVVKGAGGRRTLGVTALDGFHGPAELSFAVADGTDSTPVRLTVFVPNRGPDLSTATTSDRTLAYPADTLALTLTRRDPDDPSADLGYLPPTLTPEAAELLTADLTPDGRLTLTRRPGRSGNAAVTVTVRDPGGLTAAQTFTFQVRANAAPTIGGLADRYDLAGELRVPLTFAGVEQADTLEVTAADPTGRVAARVEGTGLGRTLVLAPTGVSGPATVVVRMADGTGADRAAVEATVALTVANTPPRLTLPVTALTVATGDTAPPVVVAVADDEPGDGPVTVTAVSDNPAVVAVAVAGLTVTPRALPGAAGRATVTVTARDGAGLTAVRTFAVDVPETDPTLTGLPADLTLAAGGTAGSLAVRVADRQTPADRLVVTAAVSDPRVTATVGGTGSDRTLTLAAAGWAGTAEVAVTVADAAGRTARQVVRVTVPAVVVPPPPPPVSPPPPPAPTRPPAVLVGVPQFAAGSGAGGAVRFLNPDGSLRAALSPFPGFAGGVRTAVADFTGDGTADLAVGTGPGGPSRVRVYDGATLAELFDLAPFEASFGGGVYLAAGDVTGDGRAELVVTPDEGGGPRVSVYRVGSPAPLADFFGIEDANFRGGARAAVGDLTGDGRGDVVVAAGFGGGPRMAMFDGTSVADPGTWQTSTALNARIPRRLGDDFFAFEETLRNGAFVTAGDVDGDGRADLVAGGGPGGGPRVLVYAGAGLVVNDRSLLADFFAGDPADRGGVRLAVKDLDGDRRADLVTGSGAGAGGRVTGYLGKSPGGPPALTLDAFDGLGGVFVG